jgi:hypothetical protein
MSNNRIEEEPTDGLTREQDGQLAELLSKWNGGRISDLVFPSVARLTPQPCVEVVVFRKGGGGLETLLIPRPATDTVWPGMYHNPGQALRLSDYYREDGDPVNGPFQRIQRGELQAEFAERPIFVGNDFRMTLRGAEVAIVHFARLKTGTVDRDSYVWCPVEELANKADFIQHQRRHIQELAAPAYLSRFNLDEL